MVTLSRTHVSLTFVAIFVSLVLTPGSFAFDGIQDNIPDNVRRIPELGVEVPAERADAMRTQLKVLQDKIASIRESKDAGKIALLSDVMIFERAVRCALDYREFFDVKEFDKADALLAEGIKRADQLQAGKPEWITQKGLVVRGYISRIDNTVQPYGLVIPSTYAIDHSVPTRCDIWFHGRGEKLSEVNFLWDRMKNPGEFTPDHTFMLHPYGRYCNAFKFAGEVDVLEALEDVQKRYRIDEDRISVRGFSMGGAACWQFATHYADRWFAANPGAGFSETPQFLKVFQKEELKPMPWEQTLWNLYDCDKWALNLTHCPTIAYSGENDSQKQAADVMEKALAENGIRLRHVIGKGMGHKYDAESKLAVETSLGELAARKRTRSSHRLRFETYSLKYNKMHWLQVDGLEQHWQAARVNALLIMDVADFEADAVMIMADNVKAFTLAFPAGTFSADSRRGYRRMAPKTKLHIRPLENPVRRSDTEDVLSIDGPHSDGSLHCSVVRDDSGKWRISASPEPGLRKRHNLQGPIDDAFMDSFIFVRPTGTAANEAAGKWADAELARAIEHWRRHFRGDARVVNDVDLTDEMIQSSNIVLWGDPKSNSVLAKIADKLPIKWTAESITVKDKTYDAKTHAPILIYPNPLNPNRYVVLNSSFTFRDYAYLNNARQVPMLPDWAIIDLTTAPNAVWPGKVVDANFFDEQWQVKP
ncbi:MAG: prolyl oligopeptidase family serine peptidase [Planctomycetaceae bacterium]|nr:prolyl oligopeptidase family serine peptidase [Planctomycetaceae bacterium]